MTLRLIPNVYQMLFAKKYAQKQVTALYKKKSDQLKKSAIGLEELFTKSVGTLSQKFMKIGAKEQEIIDMFGIKPAKVIIYYFKKVSTEENKNYAKVLFLNSMMELLNFIKNEGFSDKNGRLKYWITSYGKMVEENEMAEDLVKTLRNKKNYPDADSILKKYKKGEGPLVFKKQTEQRFLFLNKIETIEELLFYINKVARKQVNPLNKNLEAFYFRLAKKDSDFLDIYISSIDENEAVPKERIIIYDVNKETTLSQDLYNRQLQGSFQELEIEKKSEVLITNFISIFNTLLQTLDIDINDLKVVFSERKKPVGVRMQKAKTAKFFKEQEKKIKVVEDLKSRTRKLIYSQWEIKRIKKKDVTLLSVGQTVLSRLRKYKAVFKKSDNAFSIFNSVLLELEQGDVWKLNPLTGIVEVNPEKEITLGKELSFFTEEKTTDILKYAKERVIIENKEVEEKKENPLFGNIIQFVTEEELVRRKKKMDSIIDKIRNAWDKDKHTYLGDEGEMIYKQNAIMRIWNKNAFDRTIEQTRALQEILYDVSKYFGLTLFLQSSEIWKTK